MGMDLNVLLSAAAADRITAETYFDPELKIATATVDPLEAGGAVLFLGVRYEPYASLRQSTDESDLARLRHDLRELVRPGILEAHLEAEKRGLFVFHDYARYDADTYDEAARELSESGAGFWVVFPAGSAEADRAEALQQQDAEMKALFEEMEKLNALAPSEAARAMAPRPRFLLADEPAEDPSLETDSDDDLDLGKLFEVAKLLEKGKIEKARAAYLSLTKTEKDCFDRSNPTLKWDP